MCYHNRMACVIIIENWTLYDFKSHHETYSNNLNPTLSVTFQKFIKLVCVCFNFIIDNGWMTQISKKNGFQKCQKRKWEMI